MNKIIIGIAAAVVGLGITAPVASAAPKFCDRHEDGNAKHVPGNIYITACPTTNTGNGGEWHYERINGQGPFLRVDGPGSIDGDLTDGKPTPPNFGN